MRLNLLLTVASFFAQLQELLSVLDSSIELTLRFIDHADLLVALSLNILVLGTLRHDQAFLKELERHVELAHLEILISDQLIDAHQVF